MTLNGDFRLTIPLATTKMATLIISSTQQIFKGACRWLARMEVPVDFWWVRRIVQLVSYNKLLSWWILMEVMWVLEICSYLHNNNKFTLNSSSNNNSSMHNSLTQLINKWLYLSNSIFNNSNSINLWITQTHSKMGLITKNHSSKFNWIRRLLNYLMI